MSSMFPPIENADGHDAGFDLAAALGIQLPDGITAEEFQEFLFQSNILSTGREKLCGINKIEQVIELINVSSNILVLTGAGISVSAGIPDFRSENGLYSTLKDKFNLTDPTTMFDMKYFLKDPSLFYSFGGDICPGFDDKKIKYYPTATHYFIKLLELKGKLLRNYTQNIDTLEYRAGINNIITCHGSYLHASCINCQFQMNGIHIQKHIFNEKIPFCPYCCPNKSDLIHLKNTTNHNNLRKHKPFITQNKGGNILQIRLPKILCTITYLQNGCPILFSFDDDVLQKAMYEDNEVNLNQVQDALNLFLENKPKQNVENNMNFRTLILKSEDTEVLAICKTAIIQWLRNEIASFGVIKPDIVFFSESLSSNYHQTLEDDIKKCDLLLILGTSLLVAPVNTIPTKLSPQIPAILINREVVGYPNQFDVYLLGNCDDIVVTLTHKLKWDFMKPIKKEIIADEDEKEDNDDVAVGSYIDFNSDPEDSVSEIHDHYGQITAIRKDQWTITLDDGSCNNYFFDEIKVKTKDNAMKAIDTMQAETEIIKYEFVEPNFYVFPNGKLPQDAYVHFERKYESNPLNQEKTDVDVVVDAIIKEEKEKEQNNNNDNDNNSGYHGF